METLSQMVKEGQVKENVFSEEDLMNYEDISQTNTEEQEAGSTITNIEETPNEAIQVTTLTEWFPRNVDNFPNLRQARISIQGVDPLEQLTVVDTKRIGTEDKSKLVVFDDSHITPVLNIPAMDMQIFNQTSFRVIYNIGNDIYIKCYSARKGLVCVFCKDVNDILIPYHLEKIKKGEKHVNITGISTRITSEHISAKLQESVNLEELSIRYKQSSKAIDLITNMDTISWLIERQGSIEDINHHLQIDNVIISMIS